MPLKEHISNVTHLLLDFLFLPIKFSPRLYVNAIVEHLLSQWVEGKQTLPISGLFCLKTESEFRCRHCLKHKVKIDLTAGEVWDKQGGIFALHCVIP